MRPCPAVSDVNLFRDFKRIIDLDAEVSNRALDFGMPEEQLHGSVRAGEKVGHGSGGVVLLRAAAKGGQWLA